MDLLRKTFRAKAKKGIVFLAGAYFSETEDIKLVVCSISPCSPAAICGQIAVGDFLLGVNGKRFECLNDLSAWIQANDVDPIWLELKHVITGLSHHVVLIKNFSEIEASTDSTEQADCGVGLEFEAEETSLVISKLCSGGAAWLAAQSPAREEGNYQMMPGDSLLAVSGKSLQGFTKPEVMRLLNGRSWTRIMLTIMHDGTTSECSVIRAPVIPSAKLPGVIKYRSAAAALPSLPPTYRTGRCGHDRGTPAPSLAGMELDVLSERTVNVGQMRESPALREVTALLTTEDKWAMAALFCSLLAEALRARRPQGGAAVEDDASTENPREEAEAGPAARGDGSGRDWYVSKAELLVAYLGMADRHRAFFVDAVVSEEGGATIRRLADYFRGRNQTAPSAPGPAGTAAGRDGDGAGRKEEPLGAEVPGRGAAPVTALGGDKEGTGDRRDVTGKAREAVWGGAEGGIEGGRVEGSAAAAAGSDPGREDGRRAWAVCGGCLVCLVDGGGGGPPAQLRYDARGRGVARRLARAVGVPWAWVAQAETALCVAVQLGGRRAEGADKEGGGGAEKGRGSGWSVGRYAKVGGAALVGGAVIGMTGGLAAPAVVAGLGVLGTVVGVGGTLAASAAAFGGLSAVLAVSFGGLGAGLVGYKVRTRRAGPPAAV